MTDQQLHNLTVARELHERILETYLEAKKKGLQQATLFALLDKVVFKTPEYKALPAHHKRSLQGANSMALSILFADWTVPAYKLKDGSIIRANMLRPSIRDSITHSGTMWLIQGRMIPAWFILNEFVR